MVGPDSDFLHPALDQSFVKLRQVGGLAVDKILKLRDAANLLVPRDGINGGLLLQLPEPEYRAEELSFKSAPTSHLSECQAHLKVALSLRRPNFPTV